MRLAAIAFSQQGLELARRLPCTTVAAGFGPEREDLKQWTKTAFETADALLFVGAAGIAVRAIAPYIRSKTTDPAVLAADEGGRFIIPLLSGHLGGANALARQLAALINAQAVLTTATDGRGLWAVDTWAKGQGLAVRTPERIKTVSAALLAGNRVGVYSRWPIAGAPPAGVDLCAPALADVVIDETDPGGAALWLAPKNRVLGVGCKRGTDLRDLRAALDAFPVEPACLCALASIDLKAEEPALIQLARQLRVPFKTYPAAVLAAVPGSFAPSAFVQKITGVDNVCERAAAAAGGRVCVPKTVFAGVTLALAEMPISLDWKER